MSLWFVAGMLAACRDEGAEVVPLTAARCVPGGPNTEACWAYLRQALLAPLERALPVAGFVGLAMIVYLTRRPDLAWPARLRWAFISLALWGVTTTLTIFIFWPALWVAPLEVFFFMRDYAADSIDGRLNYFWGELTHDEPLPLFYPNAFLFRATPLMLLGVAVTTALALVSLGRLIRAGLRATRPDLNKLWQIPSAARWTVLALGLYSVLYGLVLNAGALKRDRYLMPIFPAVTFIAAAGLLWLITWLARRWPTPLQRPPRCRRWPN